ncbi:hypothetical protein [Rhizobium sp. BK379]|uniref:hypothetical protein n=1 Tax=Rhizobium sp. BK379 TaxID=2587059 RepID=UPI00161DE400|nr:hypothetical protein [Rhizobium sp. BK379]MBB3445884.1 hypothetical protein [Rhizobium sp. BK379]
MLPTIVCTNAVVAAAVLPHGPNYNPMAVVNAANSLLNRAWGAPKQQVDVDVTHKQDWSALISALDAHNVAKTLTRRDAPLVIEGDVIELVQEDDPE